MERRRRRLETAAELPQRRCVYICSYYQGIRLNTNHGIPFGVITKPEILIGILKLNVFIVISYTAYDSSWNYVRTINQNVRYVADLLSKATT